MSQHIAENNYLVWNFSTHVPKLIHRSFEAAKQEAERLANLNHGQEFHVIRSIGFAKITKPNIFTPLGIISAEEFGKPF